MSTIFNGKTYDSIGKHFSCPAGWRKLVRKLHNDIGKVCKENIDAFPDTFLVKSKFGGLSVFIGFHSFKHEATKTEVNRLIELAEYDSNFICEVTGEPGSSHVKDGWYATLSEKKAKEFGYVKSDMQVFHPEKSFRH